MKHRLFHLGLALLVVTLYCSNSAAESPLPTTLEASDTQTLRVVSYNIHHAAGVDGKLDVKRIADVLAKLEGDVIVLQEVDRKTKRVNQLDLVAEIAKSLDMKFVFGRSIELQGGEYGNAILSRFPIERSETIQLPNIDNGEQRTVLHAVLEWPDAESKLRVLATHFDHRRDPEERRKSASLINERLTEWTGPAILAGDLNATFDSETLEILREQWRVANDVAMATVPVDQPNRQIDFILSRPANRWTTRRIKVGDEQVASDHRPIVAELQWHSDAQ